MSLTAQRIDPGAMRRTLGRFTTGVTVVTTAQGSEIHAMTANAFTSVSLDPPLVLVSVDHRTRMHALLPDTRRYGVSVLASDQERVAWHFAGRPLALHRYRPYQHAARKTVGESMQDVADHRARRRGHHAHHLG